MNDLSPATGGDTKVCPYCAETIKAAAVVCRYCGRDLATGTLSQPTAANAQSAPVYVVEPKQSRGGGCLKVAGVILLLLVGLAALSALGRPSITRTNRSSTSLATVPTPTLTLAQLQGRAVSVPFDDLARNTEQHEGKLLEVTGTVIQVIEDGSEAQLRVNINGNYEQTVFVQYPGYNKARVLEDDNVKMIALVEGRITYKSVLGNEVTLPALTALWLQVVK